MVVLVAVDERQVMLLVVVGLDGSGGGAQFLVVLISRDGIINAGDELMGTSIADA